MITGASGYIGHKLALEAAAKNYTVHVLVRDLHSKFLPVHPNIHLFEGDVTNKESILVAMKGCSHILHSAGITKMWDKDSSIFYKVNVEGTRNVLDAALQCEVQKFVFTSTGAVIGPSGKYPMNESDPRITAFENDYEISKHWAEELVKEYCQRGLFAIIAVAPRVYGPGIISGGNVFGRLLQKIFSMKMAFVPACGDVLANYAFVDDVVNGHFLALEKGIGGEKYILGGENISYTTFFETIKNIAGKKIRLIRVSKTILFVWSFLHMLFFRLMGKHTNISPAIVRRIAQNRALSCEKAIRQLGYTITPFTLGIQRTIHHLSQRDPFGTK